MSNAKTSYSISSAYISGHDIWLQSLVRRKCLLIWSTMKDLLITSQLYICIIGFRNFGRSTTLQELSDLGLMSRSHICLNYDQLN